MTQLGVSLEVIRKLEDFQRLRREWNDVLALDPFATVFQSPGWVGGWLEMSDRPWTVIVARRGEGGPALAFWALCSNRNGSLPPLTRCTTVSIAGSPEADYTAIVARPESADAAIAAILDHVLRNMTWDRFAMHDVRDPRLERALVGWGGDDVRDERRFTTACAAIDLPPSWEEYLRTRLRSRSRESLRRVMRRIDRAGRVTLCAPDAETLGEHLDVLLRLWHRRWPMHDHAEVARHRRIFERCFDDGCLWLRSLRRGTTTLAVLAGLDDRRHDTFRFYMSAYDPAHARESPGRVLMGLAIRDAIESGYRTFDMTRGAERYKFAFGAEEFRTTTIVVRRRAALTATRAFLERCRARLALRSRWGGS